MFQFVITLLSTLSLGKVVSGMTELDAHFHLNMENSLNRLYMKGSSPLVSLINVTSNNTTEEMEDLNDIEDELTLNNYQNMMVYINLYFGSNQKECTILFDTGSQQLFVNSRLCDSCYQWAEVFDERESNTYGFYPAMVDLHYGSGSIYGHQAYDTVCIQENQTCANNFGFVHVHHSAIEPKGALPVSGLLGMSPRSMANDQLIPQMKESGAIDQKVFSIFIDWDNSNSKISFGGFDLSKYAHPSQQYLDYVNLTNQETTQMWFIPFQGMRMLAPPNVTEDVASTYETNIIGGYAFQPNNILIDSGTTFILLPEKDRNQLVDMVNDANPTYNCDYGQVSQCKKCPGIDAFPDLYFMINDLPYVIPKEDYVLYDSWNKVCYIALITLPGLPYYILGLNFFKNYYTVFDQEQFRVGFALSSVANERIPELQEQAQAIMNGTKAHSAKAHSTKTKVHVEGSLFNMLDKVSVSAAENVKNSQESEVTSVQVGGVMLGALALLGASAFGCKKWQRKEMKAAVEGQGEFVVL